MSLCVALLCLVTLAAPVAANVDKAVFRAPQPVTRPNGLDGLPTLSPLLALVPAQLPVRWPSDAQPRGKASWYLLAGLHPGRRYELRVCWPATVSRPSLLRGAIR